VPLSENEQRLLEQMERALYAEDPKFASALRGADPRTHARRRVIKASVGFVLGIALLMVGVIAKLPIISVIGFVVMLSAAFFALSSWRQIPAAGSPTATPSGAPRASRGQRGPRAGRPPRGRQGVMNRLEERWNRRRDQNGR
jgi:hypothetical protein